MKLLLQVSGAEGTETDINYAVITVTDEMKEYLAKRQALFVTAKQFVDDLSDLRFMLVEDSFVTFHYNVDLNSVMDEDEQGAFGERGYWEVPDDFADDEEPADYESERLVLDNDSWYFTSYDHGIEIMTREVPFSFVGIE